MVTRSMRIASTLLLCAATPLFVGCACGKAKFVQTAHASTKCGTAKCPPLTTTAGLPPLTAKLGECYAVVYVPPKFETVSERVVVKEASERVEIVPAQYEWVDERVVVKDAYTELVEEPAEFGVKETVVQVDCPKTGWIKETNANCVSEKGKPARDIFCLVNMPASQKTVRTQTVTKPATVRQVSFPAEYQTVRRQKLTCPATTRKIAIPAEFEEVQKSVQIVGGHMQWERVLCEIDMTTEKVNSIKSALAKAGYNPGPTTGKLNDQDWSAIKTFQEKKGLGVGELTYKTLGELGLAAR